MVVCARVDSSLAINRIISATLAIGSWPNVELSKGSRLGVGLTIRSRPHIPLFVNRGLSPGLAIASSIAIGR